jgi:hypothetical protein
VRRCLAFTSADLLRAGAVGADSVRVIYLQFQQIGDFLQQVGDFRVCRLWNSQPDMGNMLKLVFTTGQP